MNDTVVTEENKILHLINGRCGGNKTGYIVSQIESALHDNPEQCIIYAAPTKLVLDEVFYHRLMDVDPTRKQLITSDENIKASVNSRITESLTNGYCGCLLITHAALFVLDANLLADKWVIIDESPEQTVRFSHVEFYSDRQPIHFKKFNELVTNISVEMLRGCDLIVPSSSQARKSLYVEAKRLNHFSRIMKSKGIHQLSDELNSISLLCFTAASEHGYIYQSKVTHEKTTKLIYRAIEMGDMVRVVNSASKVWLASADFEGGLLHFFLTNYHDLSIVHIENTGIPVVHDKTNVTILPLLSDDKQWSKNFGESNRSKLDGYNFPDIPNYYLDKTVFSELFEFGTFFIQAEINDNNEQQTKSLMFVNTAKQSECELEDFIQVSTQSHGQNRYQMHNHAIWMASLLPNPDQSYALECFCRQGGALFPK